MEYNTLKNKIYAAGIIGTLTLGGCVPFGFRLGPAPAPQAAKPEYDLSKKAKDKFLNDEDVIGAYENLDFFGSDSNFGKNACRVLDREAAHYDALYPKAEVVKPKLEAELKVDAKNGDLEAKIEHR